MASIRFAVGDSVCRTDHAEYQSQSKRYEKRREDVSHSQGKFFHLIGSPIFDRLILNSFKFSYGCERLLSGRPRQTVWSLIVRRHRFGSTVGKIADSGQVQNCAFQAKLSRLFELALVLVGPDHVASVILNADHGIM
jgi:hypothetical protein